MNKFLQNFGKIFIEDVRDRTISDIDMIIGGKFLNKSDLDVAENFSSLDIKSKEFIKMIIPEIVDNCLHNFLNMFEEHEEINLLFDGQNLNHLSDGLAGELYTEDGWIQNFTRERYTEK